MKRLLQKTLGQISSGTVYIRIRRDYLRLRHIEHKHDLELTASIPFTTSRLLVGNFAAAEALVKEGIRNVCGTSIFEPSPSVLIHPLEMIEGGLSEVEDRVLRELALGAGGLRVHIWTGVELTDEEVVIKVGQEQKSYNNAMESDA